MRAWTSLGAWCQPKGTRRKAYVCPWAATRMVFARGGGGALHSNSSLLCPVWFPTAPPPPGPTPPSPQIPEEDCQALQ